ncbi:MAG: hypothetical protein H6633_14730 [Anaerolineales bacterium]|nr:hypothetical protein [Anaerolineales bacterium]
MTARLYAIDVSGVPLPSAAAAAPSTMLKSASPAMIPRAIHVEDSNHPQLNNLTVNSDWAAISAWPTTTSPSLALPPPRRPLAAKFNDALTHHHLE